MEFVATQVVRISARGTSGTTFTVELSEGSFFCVGADFLLENKINKGLEVDDVLFKLMMAEDSQLVCREKALALLGMREHGRRELELKLMQREFDPKIIKSVCDDLERLGLLDDARFAERRAQSRSLTKHFGRRKIITELIELGVASSVAKAAVKSVVTDRMQQEALAATWDKQLRRLNPSSVDTPTTESLDETSKQKLIKSLERKGFDWKEIQNLMDGDV